MSIRVAAIAGLALASGCRPAAPANDPTTAPTAVPAAPVAQADVPLIPAGSAVVVRAGATVWLGIGDERPLQLSTSYAARVIGQVGARLELDTETDAPCATPGLADFRLRLSARVADLAEITTAPIEHTLGDGRRISIAPGAEVQGQDTVTVQWGSESIAVPATSHARWLDPRSLAADRLCIERTDPRDQAGVLGLLGGGPAPIVVRGGAQVFWRDGSIAGTVARDHVFVVAAAQSGARTCFPIAVATNDELTLCFASGDVGAAPAVETSGWSAQRPVLPRVRQAEAEVSGSLDKDIIRRIVRAHLNEIRGCYNRGLERNPELKGRVAIRFTIGPDGHVQEATVGETKLEDTEVPPCMAKQISGWRFPKPEGGGNVKVTYPFVLEPL